jgi:hypothetical protein
MLRPQAIGFSGFLAALLLSVAFATDAVQNCTGLRGSAVLRNGLGLHSTMMSYIIMLGSVSLLQT